MENRWVYAIMDGGVSDIEQDSYLMDRCITGLMKYDWGEIHRL